MAPGPLIPVPPWPEQPVIYEVNTWVWLHELGRRLDDVPGHAWDELALPGVDAVWLMGVWERSPLGTAIALRDDGLVASFAAALPDVQPDDVVGSPYCVRAYDVDERLGGAAGLATARAELARRGVRLVLDFVPNHVAPDHPWTATHPERFVRGTAADAAADRAAFVEVDGTVFARGRDPYFAPWQDVVQLDTFDRGLRDATVDTLVSIGDQCDGVRCDMAMLLLNDVFAQTWGERVGAPPGEDFWTELLPRVRRRHPDMLFVAEAYWDLEGVLLEHGFDHCYDKRLYDALCHGDARSVRDHLGADPTFQRRLLRFIENHDEPRAADAFGDRLRAAAVTVATLPGSTLWHEGQFEGRRTRPPVFLRRRPPEPVDGRLATFHRDLLAAVAASGMRGGVWRLLDTSGWPDNDSHTGLVAWCWDAGDRRHVVVVNLSARPAQARVHLPWPELRGGTAVLVGVVDDVRFLRDGTDLADSGLFVDLEPWGWHVFAVER